MGKQCSLAPHLHFSVHVLPEVDCAALFQPDSPETETVRNCVLSHFLERTRKRDFLNPAPAEALLPDVLHAVRDLDAREAVAVGERPRLDPLQRRGNSDALDRVPVEDFPLVLFPVDGLLRSQLL